MEQQSREKKIYRVTIVGSIVNTALLVLKFAAGILGHSAAMIADAVHSLSDFITDIVVIVFVKLSSKPADVDHNYGHGKYETIATSIIGIALAVVAVMLGWNGITKVISFFNGEELQSPGMIALIAALASIVLKEWVFRYTKRVSDEVNSSALEANAWHHRSDAMSSIGTAVGIGGAVLLGNKWAVLDPIAAIIVSCFIIKTALDLIRKSSGELLEESLPAETEERIKGIVLQAPEVSDIHNVYTRKVGNNIAIEMHLRMPKDLPLQEADRRAKSIEKALRDEFGSATHVMLHIEPTK